MTPVRKGLPVLAKKEFNVNVFFQKRRGEPWSVVSL